MNSILYEELSMNAHPALKTQLYDGWVLRFSNGYTNRANSVNPLYQGSIPIREKVAVCEEKYMREDLPAVFKLTDASPAAIDVYLDTQGYEKVTPTNLFTLDALPLQQDTGKTVIFTPIDSSWREHYFRLNGLIDVQKMQTASAMMDSIQNTAICAHIEADGHTIACGLCVVERGYAGLYDIVVDSEHRRKGFGYDLCRALLAEAGKHGAKSAYLQVVAANAPAVALYKKLGYQHNYQYWYRVKDGRRKPEA